MYNSIHFYLKKQYTSLFLFFRRLHLPNFTFILSQVSFFKSKYAWLFQCPIKALTYDHYCSIAHGTEDYQYHGNRHRMIKAASANLLPIFVIWRRMTLVPTIWLFSCRLFVYSIFIGNTLIYFRKRVRQSQSENENVNYSDDDGTNYGNSEIVTFMYSQNNYNCNTGWRQPDTYAII